MKIFVLDKKLANMISAGEVVENPASVVKELVENSIDAGATQIVVDIQEGGIKKIEITDNGCGIDKEDIKTAFLPHSTSKIKTSTDLECIATLGFRGEALASIASVSEIELTTKTENSELGTKILLSGGEIQSIQEIAFQNGTEISVKNLFFNTPARKKFLNTPKLEENSITKIVERFMLSYPKIKIKYIVDGKIVYNTAGTTLFDNIFAIYGKTVTDNLLEVHYTNGKYTLDGYTSSTNLSKPNRTYQISFLNGRMVKDVYMENAIQFAYQNYLMLGNFPVCFLNLTLPYNTVDVNIHPSKQEVKYENVKEINSFFIDALIDTLEKNHIKNFNQIFGEPKKEFVANPESLNEQFKTEMSVLSEDFGSSFKNKDSTLTFKSGPVGIAEINLESRKNNLDNEQFFISDFNQNTDESIFFEKPNIEQITLKEAKIPFKLIGVAFNTYIILEKEEKLVLIDQHACHERKIYDNLMAEMDNGSLAIQKLLMPFSFNCSNEEMQFFLKNQKEFANIGINYEEFGQNVLRINTVPFLLQNINLSDFISEIKANINNVNITKKQLFLKNFLARTACKSAIKGGDSLTKEEIGALLEDLDKHKVLLCPHGRPIVKEIAKKDLEKLFKRIV